MDIVCAICNKKRRKDIALQDERWEIVKNKYFCRECMKDVAELVVAEY